METRYKKELHAVMRDTLGVGDPKPYYEILVWKEYMTVEGWSNPLKEQKRTYRTYWDQAEAEAAYCNITAEDIDLCYGKTIREDVV